MSKNPPNDRFWTGKRVTVTGGHGFLGRRVVSLIESLGAKVTTFGSSEYNLTKQADIARMYADQRPEIVIHLAAKVGGIGANRDNPHVIPALIRKCLEARDAKAASVEVWGTGSPTREFLFVDDAANAIALATERYDKPEPVNIGSSQEISIKDLVELVVDLTGFEGDVVWDRTKPDGQPRRKLNVDRAWKEFGFRSSTAFRDGLRETIRWYQQVMAGSRS